MRKKLLFNVPTLVTFFRIFFIPIFLLVFYLPISWNYILATAIFGLAALTDWLDGYLARTLKQTTQFGAFLDPVADKLIVSVALILIVGEKNIAYLAIPASVIIGREIVVSALREWMAGIGGSKRIAVSFIAKVKTTVQMLALFMLLLYKPSYPDYMKISGCFLLYFAAALTLWSMCIYLKVAWSDLTLREEKQ